MNTLGVYYEQEIDEDSEEIWLSYLDGLNKEDWYKENYNWVQVMFHSKGIEITTELLDKLYYKIQENDWRKKSCGGCI